MKIMLAALVCFSWLPVDIWLVLSRHEILAGAFLLWPMILLSPWYRSMSVARTAGNLWP